MNYSYLYSVMEFYLKSETEENKVGLNIIKEQDHVVFKLGMSVNKVDKSTYELPLYLANNSMSDLLKAYKEDLMVIDEKYELNSSDNTCKYYVKLKNGRTLSIENFSVVETNNLRNYLHNITLNKDEIRVDTTNENEISMNYEPRLQETGYTSFSQLFLVIIFVADIIAVGLWIFVSLLNK